ncbi:MAG TPA: adenine nucleotide alpha hydrolase family protein [Nitrososphaeria archaeon]|nr:adenine nucleotide alpha hydrolase family protein [Nitrososphaeria archaeon]
MGARCRLCGGEASYHLDHAGMSLCSECFTRYYERKVYKTIRKHGMLRGARRVAAAVSGGKDSVALIGVLHKLMREAFREVELVAIHVDLGIPGYSEECRRIVEKVCGDLGLELHVLDLREAEGYGVPDFANTPFRRRMCGACGTVKRYHTNRMAYELGADRLATGHNLDDVVEILFELYLKGAVEEIVRMRPVSWSDHPKLVTRIKPLIELTDRENLFYVLAQDLPMLEARCPLVGESRMLRRKKLIEEIEGRIPGFRHTFYKTHLKRFLPRLEKTVEEPRLAECEVCGMPSLGRVCSYCKLVSKLRKAGARSPRPRA